MIWWIVAAAIVLFLFLLILWGVLKAASRSSIDEPPEDEYEGYSMPVNEERGLKGALKRNRKPSASEIGRGLKKIVNEKKEIIILTLLLPCVLALSSCLATKKPDPVIIKVPCNLAELKSIPETYEVEIITGESCSHYVCMIEVEAGKEYYNDRVYEKYVEYLINTYNDAKRRCGNNE